MNVNALAKRITDREGKRVAVNIAQVKEVLRITLEELAEADVLEVLQLLQKHRR